MRKAILLVLALVVFAAASRAAPGPQARLETATFAGGCFWCMQPPFDKTRGVVSTVVGYAGGPEKNPTYEQVSAGRTGHREAVQVRFDPAQVSYEQLLEIFWRSIDPTQADGQFADIGTQYRTAIFFHSEEQRRRAEASKARLAASGKFRRPIAVEILPAGPFYAAEEYHQKYYLKNPAAYKRYAIGSGRVPFLDRTWGKQE
jgi:methionine-S-sulfoxide reductase